VFLRLSRARRAVSRAPQPSTFRGILSAAGERDMIARIY
jgi:hypothetical protein